MNKFWRKRAKEKYFVKMAKAYYDKIVSLNRTVIFSGKDEDEVIQNHIKNHLKPRPNFKSNNFTQEGFKELPSKEDNYFHDLISKVSADKNVSYSEAKKMLSMINELAQREYLDNVQIGARNTRIKIIGR